MAWDRYQWITAKMEAERRAKDHREQEAENKEAGYQIDADIHEAQAQDWDKIAQLIGQLVQA